MEKFTVGVRTSKYKALPLREERRIMKKNNIPAKFEAVSVGNDKGQAALFPTDDFGEEKAFEFAKKFAELLNNIDIIKKS